MMVFSEGAELHGVMYANLNPFLSLVEVIRVIRALKKANSQFSLQDAKSVINQASILAYVAFFSMNSRRGPTSSPISMEKM